MFIYSLFKIDCKLKYSNETKITDLSVLHFVASVTIGVIFVTVKTLDVSEKSSSDKRFTKKKKQRNLKKKSFDVQFKIQTTNAKIKMYIDDLAI